MIGELIKARIKQVGISKSEVARRLHMSPANVYKIFKRQTLDLALLQRVSDVLMYDFYAHYKHLCTNPAAAAPAAKKRPNTITYTYSLRKKIAQVMEVSRELSVEEADKSVEQFLSGLDFIQDLLKDIRDNIPNR